MNSSEVFELANSPEAYEISPGSFRSNTEEIKALFSLVQGLGNVEENKKNL